MQNLTRIIPLIALCATAAQALAAADFSITVEARVSGRKQTAVSGQSMPMFAVKRGETLAVQWTAVNPASGAVLSGVTLHAVLDGNPGPGASGLYEGAVNLDFRPGERSTGSFRMPMVEPGKYVLRVETIGVRARLGKETSASMAVTV